MGNNQRKVDYILNEVMQDKPIEPIQIRFILEDFPEGGKIIINESHVFEILKVKNDTVLIRPIGTCLLARDTLNMDHRTITRRYIKDGKIVEKSL